MKVDPRKHSLERHPGFNRPLTPVERGIKIVGIGKKSRQVIDETLALELDHYLEKTYLAYRIDSPIPVNEEMIASGVSIGGLFGALLFKFSQPIKEDRISKIFSLVPKVNSNQVEVNFLNRHCLKDQKPEIDFLDKIIHFLGGYYVDRGVRLLARKLIRGEWLTYEESLSLGHFLFSPSSVVGLPRQGMESMKGFFLSYLRVRYESEIELKGLFDGLKTYLSSVDLVKNRPRLILVEPFNANHHTPFITPIIAQKMDQLGVEPFHLTGRNPGPKYGFNLLDLMSQSSFQPGNDPLFDKIKWIHLTQLCPPLEEWVLARRRLMKRPFLSTVEKFLNPIEADYLIASAFHPPYLEKMITLGEHAGYRGVMILKSGLEGGLCPSLNRKVKITCSKKVGSNYLRKDFDFSIEDLGFEKRMDFKDDFTAKGIVWNLNLIRNYFKDQDTGDEIINLRIRLATLIYQTGMNWLLK